MQQAGLGTSADVVWGGLSNKGVNMSALLSETGLRQARRSSKYSGLTQFDYTPKGTDLQLECWLEFEPYEPMTRDDPGCPAGSTLCLAEVDGCDIVEILCESTRDEIEEAFLNQDCDGDL
jgi:hypothetical protein